MRQRLPGGVLAGGASARRASPFSRAIRRIPTPRPSQRLLPPNLFGAMVTFELKDAGKAGSLPLHGEAEDDRARHLARRRAHHDALSGHGLAPRYFAQASRALGIRDNLVRISIGIEAIEDIIADLDQALSRNVESVSLLWDTPSKSPNSCSWLPL